MNSTLVGLGDKYDLSKNRVFLTGVQALVRLCLLQAERDRRAGLDTGGYVSGYRGSPLGGLDRQFSSAARELAASRVVVEPGLNEDLAATAIWGTQQAELRGEGKHDGVFAMWYGKGPGVDRTGDVFRHANLAGSSRHGGVLALLGDDHTCESSTTAHQSEFAMVDAMIPVLNPADIADMIGYGLHGWALSRYAGTWCALKCVKDNVESTAAVEAAPHHFSNLLPERDARPDGGLNIRLHDSPLAQEARLHEHKLDAVRAYVRTNGLDRVVISGGGRPSLGIVSTGKSYMDTLQALEELGLDPTRTDALGISLYKVAMPWPLEPDGLRRFARGLDLMIVVEEKRGLMEEQARAILYGESGAPPIIGKRDEAGAPLFPSQAALNPLQIAAEIAARAAELSGDADLGSRSAGIRKRLLPDGNSPTFERKPYFCAGCPHNSSTLIPDGARAYAGIGCHWMVQFMDRNTLGYTHMGGEGANWIGESRFSRRRHVFQNMGDGTYNHSGLMAVRAAVAASANMTFKILYNDAVAMTGGQNHEGNLDPAMIARDMAALGVKAVELVTDDPARHRTADLPARVHHRDRLMQVQEELAKTEGVTVLIYDQTCAAENRRRRKRGTAPEPPARAYINEAVCEGCGDCGVQSNCVAILPVDTEFGRKRQIDQHACNKDLSCIKGFCPSFVTVEGAVLRGHADDFRVAAPAASNPPEPEIPELEKPFAIAVAGVGGTGVVTLAALIGMAAHLEGRGCGIIDMAGLAQKGGGVLSHVKIARQPSEIRAIRIAEGGADLVLGCDLVVASGQSIIPLVRGGSTRVVVNSHEMMTGDFTREPDLQLPVDLMTERIRNAAGPGNASFMNATRITEKLLGDTVAANLFLLGVAYQKGLVPVGAEAIRQAVRLNGVSPERNISAFTLGRQWVSAPSEVMAAIPVPANAGGNAGRNETGDSFAPYVDRRAAMLEEYQDAAYAERYRSIVAVACDAERRFPAHRDGAGRQLSRAVAFHAHKLMAYKDEYEVARLYTDGSFKAALENRFSAYDRLRLHLAPPLLARRDPVSGRPLKRAYGPWIFSVLRLIRRFRGLRGTPFDPFGRTAERRLERQLIDEYEALVRSVSESADKIEYKTAVELAELPDMIRGFGPVKLESVEKARARKAELLHELEEQDSAASRVA